MQKVAYCIFSRVVHGAEKRVIKLALSDNELKAKEIDYLLIINQVLYNNALNHTELKQLFLNNASRIIVLKESKFNFLKQFWLICQLFMLKYRYSINIFHTYLNARNISLLLALIKVRVIFEITSPDIADSFIRNLGSRRFFYYRLDRINCVSRSIYDRIREKINDSSIIEKLTYISKPYIKTEILNHNDLSNKDNIIIYASRFIARKNVLLFSQIVSEALVKFPNWKVKILGSGPLKDQVYSILDAQIKNDQVYIGYSDNIVNEFKKSKIIVSLIEPDNYPSQSIFEAMAMGNAILVSNTGHSKSFVENDNGIVSNSYKEDLINMISDEVRLQEMCINSIDFYKSHFSEDLYFKELLKLYKI